MDLGRRNQSFDGAHIGQRGGGAERRVEATINRLSQKELMRAKRKQQELFLVTPPTCLPFERTNMSAIAGSMAANLSASWRSFAAIACASGWRVLLAPHT